MRKNVLLKIMKFHRALSLYAFPMGHRKGHTLGHQKNHAHGHTDSFTPVCSQRYIDLYSIHT